MVKANAAAQAFKAMDDVVYELSYRVQLRGSQLSYEPICQHLAILSALLGNVHHDLKNLWQFTLAKLADNELSPEAIASLRQLWDLCSSMVSARSDFLAERRADPTTLIIPRSPFPVAEAGIETEQTPASAAEQDLLRFVQRIMQAAKERAQRFLRMLADLDSSLEAFTAVLKAL